MHNNHMLVWIDHTEAKLFEISRFLQAPVAYFFQGLPAEVEDKEFSESESEQSLHGFLMTPEGMELAAVFPKVRRARVRRRILDLVRAMVDEDDGEPEPAAPREPAKVA